MATCAVAGGGCAGEVDDGGEDVTGESGALHSLAPRLIQPGAAQVVLAVTEDDHAIYQEGQAVYATRLVPGASRRFVCDVPAGNLAFPLQVGKVAFIWCDPKRNAPGFGVSPLYLYTAEGGAVQISRQASVGLVATAASPDGRQIIFPTNVSDDGRVGDLAYALTRKPLEQTLLLERIEMNFPAGRCRPLAGFTGDGLLSFPIAEHCVGSDTTATLSVWIFGRRQDLVSNIVTPLRFILESDVELDRFIVRQNDGISPRSVSAAGPGSSIGPTRRAPSSDGAGRWATYRAHGDPGRDAPARLPGPGDPDHHAGRDPRRRDVQPQRLLQDPLPLARRPAGPVLDRR